MNQNYSELEHQIICFAAICQSVGQISTLAHKGTWDEESSRIAIRALAVDSPNSIDEIYPLEKLQSGFKFFFETFESNRTDAQMIDQSRMVMYIIHLGTSFYKQLIVKSPLAKIFSMQKVPKDVLDMLDQALNKSRQYGYSPTSNENVANIAEVYTAKISKITASSFKIYGNACYLKQQVIQDRIRTLIFAAIRAVILWRQLGGKGRDLLFNRKKMFTCAHQLLQHRS